MLSLCRCHNRQHGIIVIRFGLKELVQTARDILFPLRCLDCGAGLPARREVSFCDICLQNVRLIHEPFCTICGTPFDKAAGESHRCGVCLKKSWHFMQARAVVRYEGAIAEALKSFKYRGKTHGLATFAAFAEDYFRRYPRPLPDFILPVPLHQERLRRRGFNQALVLSRKIFPQEKKRINPFILERSLKTLPQTGLSSSERKRNVRNAFTLKDPEIIRNKKILLVDDVFTTGATVNECARILLSNQAAEVEIFTFARAVVSG